MEYILTAKLQKIKKLLHTSPKKSIKPVILFCTALASGYSAATGYFDIKGGGGGDVGFDSIGPIGPGISDRLNIKASSTDVMGDQISLSSGGLSIQITDDVLKGNGPSMSLIRHSTFGVRKVEKPVEYVGGWELPIPYVKTTTLHLGLNAKGPWEQTNLSLTACTNEGEFGLNQFYTNLNTGGGVGLESIDNAISTDTSDLPTPNFVQYAAVGTHEFYNGIFFSIPGQVHEAVGEHIGAITKSGWKKGCVDNSDSTIAGAFPFYYQMTSPTGTVYSFNQPKRIIARSASGSIGAVEDTYMLITNITDRFGNTVDYNYSQQSHVKPRLENIVASDGRKIVFHYAGEETTQITQADITTTTAETPLRSYKYGYQSSTTSYVERPDGKKWLHNLSNGYLSPGSSNSCGSTGTLSFDITHPNGLRADYNLVSGGLRFSNLEHRSIWIPSHKSGSVTAVPDRQSNLYESCSANYVIDSKKLTLTNGQAYQWQYDYNSASGYYLHDYDDNPVIPTDVNKLSNSDIPEGLDALHIKTTKVTEPDGSYTIHFYNINAATRHLDAEVATQSFDKDGTKKQTIVNVYDDTKAIFVHVIAWFNESKESATHRAVQTQRIITSHTDTGDDVYTTNYSDHNDYALPRLIHSEFSGKNKYTKQSYMHDEDLWVINQPTKTEISNVNSSYTTVAETSYYAKTHASYPSMPYQDKSFGVWQKAYSAFYKDGNIKRVDYNSPLTVGSGNRHQIFENYKRGIAQTVKVPNRLSATYIKEEKVVNDLGQVTSSTDYNGNITGYKYDELGRLKSVDVPSTFEDTLYSWSNNGGESLKEPIRTSQRCILDSTKTACTGNVKFTATTTFDNLYRPVLTAVTDGKNTTYSNKTFDVYGNVTFQSYPSIDFDEKDGTDITYDALQRPVKAVMHHAGSIITSYLSGNAVRRVDAQSNTTTTTYLAYGSPSYQQPIVIESPESVTTTLDINVFGDVKSINQASTLGYSVNETEYRAYDAQHRLCQVERKDVGTTVLSRNIAGEVVWQAQGQVASSHTVCNTTAISGSGVNFSYDNLGAQRTISYADGTPTRTFTLDNNGNVKGITGGGFSQSYNYNSLNLLEDESLTINGRSGVLTLDYDYSTLGHLSSLKYPGDIVPVSFSPNGFGQPTKAIRDYAGGTPDDVFVKGDESNLPTYHINGSIYSFTYGNGIVHKTELNERLMPKQITDKLGTSDRVNLSYEYDYNSNITKITNTRDAGIYNLTGLTYDGLDRLKSTQGGNGIGSTTLTYDGLGNIRKYKNTSAFDEHDLSYSYSNNRLSHVVNTGTTTKVRDFTAVGSYDTRGNVLKNGNSDEINNFSYNIANQMTSAGGNRYVYDGYNRRIKTEDSKGTSYSMYSQSGKLLYRETPLGGINYILFGSKLVAKEGTGVVSSDSVMNYKPFGDSIETSKDEVGYTGHKFDTDLGLSYMQARYYDPVIGRFYSNDPVGFTGEVDTFNRYSYVANNPYKYQDPNGESKRATVQVQSQQQPLMNRVANNLVTQIQRIDTTFTNYSVRPSSGPGSQVTMREITSLQQSLRNAQSAGFCGPGASSAPGFLNNGQVSLSNLLNNIVPRGTPNQFTNANGQYQAGFSFSWTNSSGQPIKVWGHTSNPTAPVGSHSRTNPTISMAVGRKHVTTTGTTVNMRKSNPNKLRLTHLPVTK